MTQIVREGDTFIIRHPHPHPTHTSPRSPSHASTSFAKLTKEDEETFGPGLDVKNLQRYDLSVEHDQETIGAPSAASSTSRFIQPLVLPPPLPTPSSLGGSLRGGNSKKVTGSDAVSTRLDGLEEGATKDGEDEEGKEEVTRRDVPKRIG